jgi:hypothetical protein
MQRHSVHRQHRPLPDIAITDGRLRRALRSTRNRPRRALRRGASWTAAYHVQLTVAAVARPVRSSMVPLVLLAAELSWGCCSPRRYLPGGASSRHPASGVAVVDIARTPAMASVAGRCPACGVQPPIRGRPGSGCPAVRCPASPVFGHLGSLSGVRLSGPSAVHPSSVQPSGVHRPVSTVRCPTVRCPTVCCPPVGPDASVSSHTGRGRWDQAGAAGATVTAGSGRGPGGGRAVEPLGRRPSRLGAATLPRSHVGQWGRWGLAGWVRAGRPRVPAERPGRPGRRAEHLSLRLRCGRGSRLRREVAAPAAWLPSWAGCATTVRGRRRA